MSASTNVMIKRCTGLIDTRDVNDWENDFLKSIREVSQNGDRPDLLSEPRLVSLEKIHKKHFTED